MPYIIALIVTLGWLALLAFFASGEIAVMALNPLRLETEARQGSKSARLLKTLRLNPQRFLTTMLIGNNVASMSLAAYFTSQSLMLLGNDNQLGAAGATLFSAITMIVVQTLFGELVPKTLAAVATQRMASMLALPLSLTQKLFTPFSWIVESATTPLVKLLAGRKEILDPSVAIADLHTALTMAYSRGELHRTEAEVATEALDFASKSLSDVMTPRVDIVGLPESATVGDALTLVMETGFSRLPLYRSGLDEIIGVLMLKDLVRVSLKAARSGLDPDDRWALEACAPYARKPAFFPETKSIVETLAEMRQLRVHLAVVVDEHGGTAGIVSLEDILEELVGDIRDETDPEHSADIIQRQEGYVLATGRARIDSIPELNDINLKGSDTVTIGGLLMERLGRPAVVGDEVIIDGLKISALRVMRNSIKLIRIQRAQQEDRERSGSSRED